MKRAEISMFVACCLLAISGEAATFEIHFAGEYAGTISIDYNRPDLWKRESDPEYIGEGIPKGICGIEWKGPRPVDAWYWADDGGRKDDRIQNSDTVDPSDAFISGRVSFNGPYAGCDDEEYFFPTPLLFGGGKYPCAGLVDCEVTTLVVEADLENTTFLTTGMVEFRKPDPPPPPELPIADPCSFAGIDLCEEPEECKGFACLCEQRQGLSEEECRDQILGLFTFRLLAGAGGIAVNQVYSARTELGTPQPDPDRIRDYLTIARSRVSLARSVLSELRPRLRATTADDAPGEPIDQETRRRALLAFNLANSLIDRCDNMLGQSLLQDSEPATDQSLQTAQRICGKVSRYLAQLRSAVVDLTSRGFGIGADEPAFRPSLSLEVYAGRIFTDEAPVEDELTFGTRVRWSLQRRLAVEFTLGRVDWGDGSPLAESVLAEVSTLVGLGDAGLYVFAGLGWIEVSGSSHLEPAEDQAVTAHVGLTFLKTLGDRYYLRPDLRIRRVDTDFYSGSDLEGSLAIGWRF